MEMAASPREPNGLAGNSSNFVAKSQACREPMSITDSVIMVGSIYSVKVEIENAECHAL